MLRSKNLSLELSFVGPYEGGMGISAETKQVITVIDSALPRCQKVLLDLREFQSAFTGFFLFLFPGRLDRLETLDLLNYSSYEDQNSPFIEIGCAPRLHHLRFTGNCTDVLRNMETSVLRSIELSVDISGDVWYKFLSHCSSIENLHLHNPLYPNFDSALPSPVVFSNLHTCTLMQGNLATFLSIIQAPDLRTLELTPRGVCN